MKCKELGRMVQCRGCDNNFQFFPSEDTARAQLSLHFPPCPSCGFESVVKLTPTEVRVLQTYIG